MSTFSSLFNSLTSKVSFNCANITRGGHVNEPGSNHKKIEVSELNVLTKKSRFGFTRFVLHVDEPCLVLVTKGWQKYKDLLRIKMTHEFTEDTANSHDSQLMTTPNQTGKQDRVNRRPKHISMNLLPSILITYVPLLMRERMTCTL